MKFLLVASCGFILLLSGCRSDIYYQERAVERARSYLLKNARDLTPEELAYVHFNDPVLLHGDILVSGQMSAMSSNLYQICITWLIPDRKELYMVYGVSNGRMASWYPVRLLKRPAVKPDSPWQGVVSEAEKYAIDNLYESLSVEEMNQIRFGNPWLMQTKFDLNLETVAAADPEKAVKIDPEKMPEQYSLVWKFTGGRSLVFAGLNPPWKGGWKILFAAFVSEKELKESTVKIVATPENLHTIVLDEDEAEPKKVPVPEKKNQGKEL